MKVIKTLLAIGVMTASFAPQAEVGLNFHHELAPIIVDGEELKSFTSFSTPSDFTLDNGTNQIVFRMEKLIDGQGDREKFNSKAFVLSFTAKDTKVRLEPTVRVLRNSQAKEFDRNPQVALIDRNGNNVNFTLAPLPVGDSLLRDYSAELAAYNEKNGISVKSKKTEPVAVAQVSTSSAPSLKVEADKIGPESMIQYWLEKATAEESEAFVNWAFENRAVATPQGLEGSKALSMLSHWYSEADTAQRKQILAWLISR